ncbi:MAG: DoxX family protein [Acidobacteriaceae bacterium]
MSQWLNRRQPWRSLVLRLALSLSITVHCYQKVVPHGALHHYLRYIAALGLPWWLGYFSAFTEFAGGILLFFGLFTRPVAALVTVDMLVALFAVGIHRGFGMYSYIVALVAITIMLVFTGGGAMSLDRKFGFS